VAEELLQAGADDYMDKRGMNGDRLARCLRGALRRSEAFRARQPAAGGGKAALTACVRELYQFLARLGPDAMTGHLDAVLTAARRAGGLDNVAAAFESVCHDPGVPADAARRVLEPYLLEVLTRLGSTSDSSA
jgi:hypothetical protein